MLRRRAAEVKREMLPCTVTGRVPLPVIMQVALIGHITGTMRLFSAVLVLLSSSASFPLPSDTSLPLFVFYLCRVDASTQISSAPPCERPNVDILALSICLS
jgi:hypothetical protein